MYFQGLEFGPECEDTKEAFREYEAKCMKNYAQILLDIIHSKPVKVDKEGKMFEELRKIIDPMFYYIIWFMHKEKKERKIALVKGNLKYEVEYENDIEQTIKSDKGIEEKTSIKKGKTSQKGVDSGKRKHLSLHTMIQHGYFKNFEENIDLLLEEFIKLFGEKKLETQ